MSGLDEAVRQAVREEVRAVLDEWEPPVRPLTYSVQEIAKKVGTSVDRIRNEIHEGRLAILNIGSKAWQVPAIELDRWIAERTEANGAPAPLRDAS